MGTAKPGLTGERHREIAAELHQIRERLAQLAIEVGHAYPRIETLGTNLRGRSTASTRHAGAPSP